MLKSKPSSGSVFRTPTNATGSVFHSMNNATESVQDKYLSMGISPVDSTDCAIYRIYDKYSITQCFGTDDSASTTLRMILTERAPQLRQIFIKGALSYSGKDYIDYRIEALIYWYLTHKRTEGIFTQFVSLVGTDKCTIRDLSAIELGDKLVATWEPFVNTDVQNLYDSLEQMYAMYHTDYKTNPRTIRYIMTNVIPNTRPITQLIKNPASHVHKNILAVLRAMYLMIIRLHWVGVRHMDLHTGNVMCNTEKTLPYDKSMYIYDYDRSILRDYCFKDNSQSYYTVTCWEYKPVSSYIPGEMNFVVKVNYNVTREEPRMSDHERIHTAGSSKPGMWYIKTLFTDIAYDAALFTGSAKWLDVYDTYIHPHICTARRQVYTNLPKNLLPNTPGNVIKFRHQVLKTFHDVLSTNFNSNCTIM